MLGIPDEILRESGLPGHRRDELLVVEGDTQLLRQLLGDEPPAGTVLPADGDDNVLHKDTSYNTNPPVRQSGFYQEDCPPSAEYREGRTVAMEMPSMSPLSHICTRSGASAYTSAPHTWMPCSST